MAAAASMFVRKAIASKFVFPPILPELMSIAMSASV